MLWILVFELKGDGQTNLSASSYWSMFYKSIQCFKFYKKNNNNMMIIIVFKNGFCNFHITERPSSIFYSILPNSLLIYNSLSVAIHLNIYNLVINVSFQRNENRTIFQIIEICCLAYLTQEKLSKAKLEIDLPSAYQQTAKSSAGSTTVLPDCFCGHYRSSGKNIFFHFWMI